MASNKLSGASINSNLISSVSNSSMLRTKVPRRGFRRRLFGNTATLQRESAITQDIHGLQEEHPDHGSYDAAGLPAQHFEAFMRDHFPANTSTASAAGGTNAPEWSTRAPLPQPPQYHEQEHDHCDNNDQLQHEHQQPQPQPPPSTTHLLMFEGGDSSDTQVLNTAVDWMQKIHDNVQVHRVTVNDSPADSPSCSHPKSGGDVAQQLTLMMLSQNLHDAINVAVDFPQVYADNDMIVFLTPLPKSAGSPRNATTIVQEALGVTGQIVVAVSHALQHGSSLGIFGFSSSDVVPPMCEQTQTVQPASREEREEPRVGVGFTVGEDGWITVRAKYHHDNDTGTPASGCSQIAQAALKVGVDEPMQQGPANVLALRCDLLRFIAPQVLAGSIDHADHPKQFIEHAVSVLSAVVTA